MKKNDGLIHPYEAKEGDNIAFLRSSRNAADGVREKASQGDVVRYHVIDTDNHYLHHEVEVRVAARKLNDVPSLNFDRPTQ